MERKVWTFADHINTVKNCQSFVDRNETFLAAGMSTFKMRILNTYVRTPATRPG